MKKIIFGLVIMLSTVAASGQTVDGVNLGERKEVEYIKLMGIEMGVFKKKLIITVDYGQKVKAWESDITVSGPDGKPIVFNSMMDALNQFHGWGWELITTYYISDETNKSTILHYVMRRKKA